MCDNIVALGSATAERAALMARCFDEADRATTRWDEQVKATPTDKKMPRSYAKIWEKLIKACGYNFGFRPDYASTPGG